ncbi:MAG: sulfotransferase [Geminicoccaceae bacterium]
MSDPAAGAGPSDAWRLWLASWVFTPLAGVTLGDWLGVLRRHGTDIPPRYWARTLFTTLMAAMNSVLARLEKRRCGERLGAVQVRRPVFIIGHHRSGTTHLWNLMAQDPRTASPTVLQAVFPHSFLTFERLAERWARRLAPTKRPQDNVRFGPNAPIEEERAICASTFLSIQMARHFPKKRETFQRFLSMADATPAERKRWKHSLDAFARKLLIRYGEDRTLLFKAPDHTAKIALILELYPDARFIHIHRDPYTVYQSTLKMERTTLPLYAYQRIDEDDGLGPFILWRYQTMYEAFFTDQPKIPQGQFAETSFDDLERRPVQTLERIYGELGLPDFASVRPAIERYLVSIGTYRKNAYAPLETDLRARVADAWAPAFAHWGYAQ